MPQHKHGSNQYVHSLNLVFCTTHTHTHTYANAFAVLRVKITREILTQSKYTRIHTDSCWHRVHAQGPAGYALIEAISPRKTPVPKDKDSAGTRAPSRPPAAAARCLLYEGNNGSESEGAQDSFGRHRNRDESGDGGSRGDARRQSESCDEPEDDAVRSHAQESGGNRRSGVRLHRRGVGDGSGDDNDGDDNDGDDDDDGDGECRHSRGGRSRADRKKPGCNGNKEEDEGHTHGGGKGMQVQQARGCREQRKASASDVSEEEEGANDSEEEYLRRFEAREDQDDEWQPQADDEGAEARTHKANGGSGDEWQRHVSGLPRKRGRPSKAEMLAREQERRRQEERERRHDQKKHRAERERRDERNRVIGKDVRANRGQRRPSPSPSPPRRRPCRDADDRNDPGYTASLTPGVTMPRDPEGECMYVIPMEGRVWETPKGFARAGGDWLIGRCIRVYWDADDQWYPGIVGSYDARRDAEDSHGNKGPVHDVFYEDGSYLENLHHARWQFDLSEGPALRPKIKRKAEAYPPNHPLAKRPSTYPYHAHSQLQKSGLAGGGAGAASSLGIRGASTLAAGGVKAVFQGSAVGWTPFQGEWEITALRREVDALTGREMQIEWKCLQSGSGVPEWRPDSVVKHEALFKIKIVE